MRKFSPLLFAAGLIISSVQAKNIPSFAAADLVLGQPNFVTATVPPAAGGASLDEPSAVVVHAGTGKVFIADTDNNRVLRYANAAALRNGAAADLVFGQTDFVANGSASPPTAASLDSPTGLWVDPAGRLWVADSDNNRVVMYANATASQTNGPSAVLVLGQPDFMSEAVPATASAASMNNPAGLCVDAAGRLWVADTSNNRVLRFGTISPNVPAASMPNGAAANGLLGQSQVDGTTAGDASTQLSQPIGVAVDPSGTLWVADRANNRVVGYPSAGTVSNGTNGARVLGQPDLNGSTDAGTTAATLRSPSGVFADAANNLWVLDQGNNRALRFANLSAIENGKPATVVVGQPNFTDGLSDLNDRRLDAPFLGIFVEPGGHLWLGDLNHNRVLRFAPADDQIPVVRIKGRANFKTKRAALVLRGTASDDVGVTRIALKIGTKNAGNATIGTGTWKKTVRLRSGRNIVQAIAEDASRRRSRPARVVITRP